QLVDHRFGERLRRRGRNAPVRTGLELDEQAKVSSHAHGRYDFAERRYALAVARDQSSMAARVKCSGLGAADVETAQLSKRERPNWQRTAPCDPMPLLVPAQFRLEPQIVKADELVISRQLHIGFGAVVTGARRRFESKPRIFRPESCPSTMRDIEGYGHRTARPSLRCDILRKKHYPERHGIVYSCHLLWFGPGDRCLAPRLRRVV